MGDSPTEPAADSGIAAKGRQGPLGGALTAAAFEIMRSTRWRRADLRDAADFAAQQVRAQELLGTDGLASVFLTIVNGYRVRDQRP
jgi:hypothetical protein